MSVVALITSTHLQKTFSRLPTNTILYTPPAPLASSACFVSAHSEFLPILVNLQVHAQHHYLWKWCFLHWFCLISLVGFEVFWYSPKSSEVNKPFPDKMLLLSLFKYCLTKMMIKIIYSYLETLMKIGSPFLTVLQSNYLSPCKKSPCNGISCG